MLCGKPSAVILSEAKDLRQNGRSFASLRMTMDGFGMFSTEQKAKLIDNARHG
jgi:hypothetical protein